MKIKECDIVESIGTREGMNSARRRCLERHIKEAEEEISLCKMLLGVWPLLYRLPEVSEPEVDNMIDAWSRLSFDDALSALNSFLGQWPPTYWPEGIVYAAAGLGVNDG